MALLFDALFHWWRYPVFLLSKETEKDYTISEYASVDHADFDYAHSQMDTFIDVTEDDLLKIYFQINLYIKQYFASAIHTIFLRAK